MTAYRTPPTAEARAAILQGLRILARLDPDHASERDDVGFSASDSSRGRALAALSALADDEAIEGLDLVSRYWRQLPADLVAEARRRPPRIHMSLGDAFAEFASLPRPAAA